MLEILGRELLYMLIRERGQVHTYLGDEGRPGCHGGKLKVVAKAMHLALFPLGTAGIV